MPGPAEHYLIQQDALLAPIVSAVSLTPVSSTGNVFHDLMSCIVEQQIHYRSTKKIFLKKLQQAGISILHPDNFSQFEEKGLGQMKLSASKYETILRTVAFFNHTQPEWIAMSDDQVRTTLAAIKGIGPWTIDMILLYTLKRADIFPADDYHLKKAMATVYKLTPDHKLKTNMLEISASWSPHRSLAVQYLLAYKKSTASLI